MTTSDGRALRYDVITSESSLVFEARSTLHAVHGKADGLTGYIERGAGVTDSIAGPPPPKMHVEFAVERLRSGNDLQDREMWKVVDSKRFPLVTADLRELEPGPSEGRYIASGDVALAGRSRRYSGDLSFEDGGDRVIVQGALNLDIRDFGLKPPEMLFLKVDPVVALRLRLVAARAA